MTTAEIIQTNKDQILKWYLEDELSQRKIADKLKVGKSSIGHYLKNVWEISAPDKKSDIYKTLIENKDYIIDLYVNQKKTANEISKEFNVSRPTIVTYLKQFGVILRPNYKDLTNQIFGYLQALEPLHENGFRKWHCKCLLCGQGYKNVLTNDLISGKIIHCGCAYQSKGVLKIRQVLEHANIPYKTEYWFEDFRYKESKMPIQWDFYVNNQYLIEYDGEQHFRNVGGYFHEEHLAERIRRDQMKNKYSLEHNIPLIRIPYTYEKQINLDILTPTENNPFVVDCVEFRKEFFEEI